MGDTAEGKYANYFEVGFKRFEILLDFGQFDPELQKGIRHTRLILNPASARVFLNMLADVMAKYEAEVEGKD
jgi:hypothetical protein